MQNLSYTEGSDPIFDEFVKKVIKSIEEMRSMGWKTTTILAPSESMADKLEKLIKGVPQMKYTKIKCSFEVTLLDHVEEEIHFQPQEITEDELALLQFMANVQPYF